MNYNLELRLRADQDQRRLQSGGPLSFEDLRQWFHNHPQFEIWLVAAVVRPSVYNLKNADNSAQMRAVQSISPRGSSFEVDEAVLVGFYCSRRDDPYILGGVGIMKANDAIIPDLARWTHWLANGARTNQALYTGDTAALSRYNSLVDVWTNVVRQAVRVWEGDILVNTLWGASIGRVEWGQSYDSWDLWPFFSISDDMDDWALDADNDGAIYVMARTVIGGRRLLYKIDRSTLAQVWVSPLWPAGEVGVSRSLIFWGDPPPEPGDPPVEWVGGLVVKTDAPAGVQNRLTLRRFLRGSTGALQAPVLLASPTLEPPFSPEEILPLMTMYLRLQSLPALYWPIWWIQGEGSPHRYRWPNAAGGWTLSHPWPQAVSDRPESSLSTSEVIWGDPARPAIDHIETYRTPQGALVQGRLIIPQFADAPALVGYRPTGEIAWEVRGWDHLPDGEFSFRDFYTPIMIVNDMIVVRVLRQRFHTIDFDFRAYRRVARQLIYHGTTEYPDWTIEWEWHYASMGTWVVDETTPVRGRIAAGSEALLEFFTLDGQKVLPASSPSRRQVAAPHTPQWKLAGVPFWPAATKIRSLYHVPGSWMGDLPPEHYVWIDDFDSHPGVPMEALVGDAEIGLPEDPWWHDLRQDGPWYPLSIFRPPHPASVVSEPTDRLRAGERWIVSQAGVIGDSHYPEPIGLGGWVHGYHHPNTDDSEVRVSSFSSEKYESRQHHHISDPPDVVGRTEPIASSNRGLLIFWPRAGSKSTAAGQIREWTEGSTDTHEWAGGNQANFWMHQVTMTGEAWQPGRVYWEARRLIGPGLGDVVWRHTMTFDPAAASTLYFSRPCCGAGRMVVAYRLSGQHRLRVWTRCPGH